MFRPQTYCVRQWHPQMICLQVWELCSHLYKTLHAGCMAPRIENKIKTIIVQLYISRVHLYLEYCCTVLLSTSQKECNRIRKGTEKGKENDQGYVAGAIPGETICPISLSYLILQQDSFFHMLNGENTFYLSKYCRSVNSCLREGSEIFPLASLH